VPDIVEPLIDTVTREIRIDRSELRPRARGCPSGYFLDILDLDAVPGLQTPPRPVDPVQEMPSADDRYSSLGPSGAVEDFGALVPKVRTLLEATYLAGLRTAGMPEE
jgi:hypothetical protein